MRKSSAKRHRNASNASNTMHHSSGPADLIHSKQKRGGSNKNLNGSGGQMNKQLAKEDVDLLLNNNLYSEDKLKVWHEAFSKDCPNGRLERKQFGDAYEQCCGTEKRDQFVNFVYRNFDTDNNGWITFTKFLVALSIASNTPAQDKLNIAFAYFTQATNTDESGQDGGMADKKTMIHVINSIYDLVDETDRSGDRSPKNRAIQIFKKANNKVNNKITQKDFVGGCSTDAIVGEVVKKCVISHKSY